MAAKKQEDFRIEQLKAEWLGLTEKLEALRASSENERGFVRMEKTKINQQLDEIEARLRGLVNGEGTE